MSIYIDTEWASLSKYEEELSGDHVEVVRTDDAVVGGPGRRVRERRESQYSCDVDSQDHCDHGEKRCDFGGDD